MGIDFHEVLESQRLSQITKENFDSLLKKYQEEAIKNFPFKVDDWILFPQSPSSGEYNSVKVGRIVSIKSAGIRHGKSYFELCTSNNQTGCSDCTMLWSEDVMIKNFKVITNLVQEVMGHEVPKPISAESNTDLPF